MTELTSRAALLAADLAGAHVDINEAQKALAYLRKARTPERFFDYLRAIVRDGRAVIRSNQTLDYYRELLAACERHLRGMDAAEMAQTLGWAVRLLRYYRAFPEHAPSREVGAGQRAEPVRPTTESALRPQPAAAQLPEVGDIFGGQVLAVDPQGVRVKVKNLGEDVAIGVIKADALAGKQYRVGDTARVEVIGKRTIRSGVVVLDLRPAPRRQG
jgi:hypothetical protein